MVKANMSQMLHLCPGIFQGSFEINILACLDLCPVGSQWLALQNG